MARLFGLISKVPVEISLTIPSMTPKGVGMHGWGIVSYDQNGAPIVKKGKLSAVNPGTNPTISINVASRLIISHIRFATSGSVVEENVHPFQFSSWAFAHSGSVSREKILAKLKKPYNENFQSEPIDSEVYFRFILQSMKEYGEREGLRSALVEVEASQAATFLLSDGVSMYAYSKGIPLYWLFRRSTVPLSAQAPETGIVFKSGVLSGASTFFIASERLDNDSWNVMDHGELLIVRKNLQYTLVKI